MHRPAVEFQRQRMIPADLQRQTPQIDHPHPDRQPGVDSEPHHSLPELRIGMGRKPLQDLFAGHILSFFRLHLYLTYPHE